MKLINYIIILEEVFIQEEKGDWDWDQDCFTYD